MSGISQPAWVGRDNQPVTSSANSVPTGLSNIASSGLSYENVVSITKRLKPEPEESSSLLPDQPPGKIETMDHDLVDAKIAASEARTDAKFAELRGEMRTGFADIRTEFAGVVGEIKAMRAEIAGRLDHVEKSTGGLRANIWIAAVSAVALAAAVLAWGGDQFGRGVDIGSRISQSTSTASSSPAAQPPAPPPVEQKAE